MALTATLYLNQYAENSPLPDAFWQYVENENLPGSQDYCNDIIELKHRVAELLSQGCETLFLIGFIDTNSEYPALTQFAHTIDDEIVKPNPTLKLQRNLCLINKDNWQQTAKQLQQTLYTLKKYADEKQADTHPDWQKTPAHRYHIFFCIGTRCQCRGSQKMLQQLRQQLTIRNLIETENGVLLTRTHCQYPCDLGPIVTVYPDGLWYRLQTPEDVHRFVVEQIEQGNRVDDLIVARNQLI